MYSYNMLNKNKFISCGSLGRRYIFQRRVFSLIVGFSVLIILIHLYGNEPHATVYGWITGSNTLDREHMRKMDNVMDNRRRYLKEQCHQYGLQKVGVVNAFEYLINEKYNLIWCNVFKAASTSWMYNFNLMAGISKERCDSTVFQLGIAREVYPRPSKEELYLANEKSTSMFIVRHPFDRLSSAYRDKIQNSPIPGMYYDVGISIILKYRERGNNTDIKELLKPHWPTFYEFITFLLDEFKSNNTLDMHWIPYTTFCTPCHFDFDVILKVETLQEEQDYLIKKARIGDVVVSEWKNDGTIKNTQLSEKSNALKENHFSQLTIDQITQLYEFYKYDFLLFNYTVSEYYKYAKK